MCVTELRASPCKFVYCMKEIKTIFDGQILNDFIEIFDFANLEPSAHEWTMLNGLMRVLANCCVNVAFLNASSQHRINKKLYILENGNCFDRAHALDGSNEMIKILLWWKCYSICFVWQKICCIKSCAFW